MDVETIPVSDGGEGFIDSVRSQDLQEVHLEVENSYPGNNIVRPAEILIDNTTAYLEVANICGLQDVSPEFRNPWVCSSLGVGQAMRRCFYDHHIRNFVIGCGGSSFSDAGFGCV